MYLDATIPLGSRLYMTLSIPESTPHNTSALTSVEYLNIFLMVLLFSDLSDVLEGEKVLPENCENKFLIQG